MIPRYAARCRPRELIGRAAVVSRATTPKRRHPPLLRPAHPAIVYSRWNHDDAQRGILPTLSAVSTRPSHPLSAVALLPGSNSSSAGQETRSSTKKRRSRRSRGKSKRQESKQVEPTLTKKDKLKSPFGGQLPKYELHRWYLKQHPEFEFDDQTYQFTQVKEEVSWLTATFTCPVTQQVYESGTFRTQERWGDSKVINGKVHYRNLTAAVHAAAARAMDDILFNETGRSEPRLCEEDPSKPSTIQFFIASQTPKWNVNNYYTHMHGIERFHKDPYHVTKIFQDDKYWYNANFTCPVMQKVFESGTRIDHGEDHRLIDGKVFYSSAKAAVHAAAARVMDDISFREGNILEPRLCEEPPVSFDDNNKAMIVEGENAEIPAAEPETIEAMDKEEDSEVASPVRAPVPSRRTPASIQYYETERVANEDEYVIQNISGADASNERKSALERVLEAWAESVSKPKQVQPARSSDISRTHMPMSWSLIQQKEKAIKDALSWYAQMEGKASGGFSKMHNDMMSRAAGNAMLKALANANDLTLDDYNLNRRLQETAHQILDHMGKASRKPNTETYNAYLGCLSRSDRLEAAQAAQAILQSMKSQDDDLPEPNIETYNTVMKLWRDVGGDEGLTKCEELMAGLEDDRLKPTRESFLILLSSMALPRDDRAVFPMETALKWIARMRSAFTESMDENLVPDTEVYNAPLRWSGGVEGAISRPFSYVAPWDDHFSIFGDGFRPQGAEIDETPLEKEAQQYESWLHHMEDAKILPDIQTYESIIQAWTRTGTREGVKKAESWAKQAIDSGFDVRLQTFHPILAAWAYSGDIRAPRKVRYRIDRLLEMSETRPETAPDGRMYLALLTAWRSYQSNIEKLTTPPTESSYSIGQLVTLVSKDLNGETGMVVDIVRKGTFVVKLDSGNSVNKRWSSLRPIVDATLSLDNVEDSSDVGDRNPIPLLEECAQACTDNLSEMCDKMVLFRHEDSGTAFFLDASAFAQAVGAWGELVRYCQNEDDENNRDVIERGVRNMFSLTRKMEALIQEMRESYRDKIAVSPHDDIDAKYAAEDLQLRHMISSAQMTHLEILTYLNQIDAARSPDVPSFFSKNVSNIELMLRRSEEYRQLSLGSPGADGGRVAGLDTSVLYSDLYAYSPRMVGVNMAHSEVYLALLTSILEACRNSASSGNDSMMSGDLARLCSLIVNFVQKDASLAGHDSWSKLAKDVQTVMMRFKAEHGSVLTGSSQKFRKFSSSQKVRASSSRPRASSGGRRSSKRKAVAASSSGP